MSPAACPICDRPSVGRCPGCGHHPDMVAAELRAVARRLVTRLEDLHPDSPHRPALYKQILRAAKLAGHAELQPHTLEVSHV